jgi:hypothetical protein
MLPLARPRCGLDSSRSTPCFWSSRRTLPLGAAAHLSQCVVARVVVVDAPHVPGDHGQTGAPARDRGAKSRVRLASRPRSAAAPRADPRSRGVTNNGSFKTKNEIWRRLLAVLHQRLMLELREYQATFREVFRTVPNC